MKFCKLSQLLLVSAAGLAVGALLTACQIVTVDYAFVASSATADNSANGSVAVYAVDSQSGALRKGADTVSSGGVSPVALAVSPDYQHLYVANSGDNTVVHFTIADNGKLTAKDTVTLAGPPTALTVSKSGKFLYVVSGSTSATLTEFPLSSGTIGSATAEEALTLPGSNADDRMVPTGVTVLANNNAVFATAYDLDAYNPGGTTTSTANPGWVFGYSIDGSGNLAVSPGGPFRAGIKPSGIAADPTNSYLYVTDFASGQMIGYTIQSTSVLTFLLNGPFTTGSQPTAIAIDPRGKFIYVSNGLSSTVSAYAIDLNTGTPSAAVNATGSSTNVTDTTPLAVAVDPALGRYVYTANSLGNTVSGFRLDPTAGTLTQTQGTPYTAGQKPTALVLVPHGNHSIQSITP